jgi:hypothetical protein
MIRSIGATSKSLNDLPDVIFMNMKLLYYDERTPPEYEPSNFKKNTLGDYIYNGRVKIDGGKADSYWHRMSFAINVAKAMMKEMDDFNTIDETVYSEVNVSNIENEPPKVKVLKHVLDVTEKSFIDTKEKEVTVIEETPPFVPNDDDGPIQLVVDQIDKMSVRSKVKSLKKNDDSVPLYDSFQNSVVNCGCGLTDVYLNLEKKINFIFLY